MTDFDLHSVLTYNIRSVKKNRINVKSFEMASLQDLRRNPSLDVRHIGEVADNDEARHAEVEHLQPHEGHHVSGSTL